MGNLNLHAPPSGVQIISGYKGLRERGITHTRVAIWKMMKRGEFPASIELSENRIGWYAHEIDAWLLSRPRRTMQKETETV